jgi:carbon monoxide dehydrogenase subunit G
MEITDSFRVNTPIEKTWDVLLDIERIAPCLPGAQLQEIEGDEYRGVVKVKVGPITAQYKGTARLAEVDQANRRVVLDASGRDTRGQGNAKAQIEVTMKPDGSGTAVDIRTDLQITGKVAQFGRGVLADVSTKLLGQFVDNLHRDVLEGSDDTPASNGSQPAMAPTQTSAPVAEPAPESTAPPISSGIRTIEHAETEPVDLLDVAGAPVAQRLVPLGIAAVVLFILWRVLRRR